MSEADVPNCEYEGTQSGDPCELPGVEDDDRCWFHTEDSEYRSQSVMFRLRGDVHSRVKVKNRDDETLSDTVDRALDALEAEGDD